MPKTGNRVIITLQTTFKKMRLCACISVPHKNTLIEPACGATLLKRSHSTNVECVQTGSGPAIQIVVSGSLSDASRILIGDVAYPACAQAQARRSFLYTLCLFSGRLLYCYCSCYRVVSEGHLCDSPGHNQYSLCPDPSAPRGGWKLY